MWLKSTLCTSFIAKHFLWCASNSNVTMEMTRIDKHNFYIQRHGKTIFDSNSTASDTDLCHPGGKTKGSLHNRAKWGSQGES